MKNRNLIDSFNDAIDGLIQTFRSERNMKIHLIIALLVLLAAIFYNLSRIEFILLFIAMTLVIAAEMINTAIETIAAMI